MAQSFEAPHYKSESFGFDSATNSEYQGYFLWGKGSQCIGLTFSCADYLEIMGDSSFWNPKIALSFNVVV
jgi:hypothetical protein